MAAKRVAVAGIKVRGGTRLPPPNLRGRGRGGEGRGQVSGEEVAGAPGVGFPGRPEKGKVSILSLVDAPEGAGHAFLRPPFPDIFASIE